jgi:molybdenum cofactor synthesis domain-containing protein
MTELKAVAITVSDRCAAGEQADRSGPVLTAALREAGALIVNATIVSDDPEPLTELLRGYARRPDVNLIITTGGTGFGPRDNTPEATRAVIEKDAPGLAEAMRAASIAANPNAMLSRGICGISGHTLIVNLPGSPKAVTECFAVIKPVLAHAVRLLGGDTRH